MTEALLLEIHSDIKEVKGSNEKIHRDLEKINTTLSLQSQKISNIESKTVDLDNKQKIHEKALRNYNLILFKLQDSEERENNTLSKVLDIVNKIGLTIPEVCFVSCYRIGVLGSETAGGKVEENFTNVPDKNKIKKGVGRPIGSKNRSQSTSSKGSMEDFITTTPRSTRNGKRME